MVKRAIGKLLVADIPSILDLGQLLGVHQGDFLGRPRGPIAPRPPQAATVRPAVTWR